MTPEAQAGAALAALRGVLGGALRAVWLHGSAAAGGLRPGSDLDLMAVTGRPMEAGQRQGLLAALLRLSAPHPAPPGGPRCLEVVVFLRENLSGPPPHRAEFTYGEWLRAGFEAGEVPQAGRDPENTLLLAQARLASRPLLGPPAAALIPEIPPAQIRAAMLATLPALLEGLEGDTRNTLLTLARMWVTTQTGAFVAKDAAAARLIPHLPPREAATLDHARRGYLGEPDDWAGRQAEARALALLLRDRIIGP